VPSPGISVTRCPIAARQRTHGHRDGYSEVGRRATCAGARHGDASVYRPAADGVFCTLRGGMSVRSTQLIDGEVGGVAAVESGA
jgi:hypothetical protein